MTRIYLGFVTLMLLGGGAYLFDPTLFTMNGQALTVPGARTDVRAMYGALSIGLALFIFPALLRASDHRNELRLCLLLFGALALGRLLGIVLDGGDQKFNYAGLILEALFALGAALGLRRHRT